MKKCKIESLLFISIYFKPERLIYVTLLICYPKTVNYVIIFDCLSHLAIESFRPLIVYIVINYFKGCDEQQSSKKYKTRQKISIKI